MTDSLLFIDDDSDALLSLIRAVKPRLPGLHLHAASSAKQASMLFRTREPAAVVLDLCLDSTSGVSSGFALLKQLQQANPTVRILVLTGHDSRENGIKCLSLGAANFLTRPVEIDHLAVLLKDAVVQYQLRREVITARKQATDSLASVFIGTSPAVLALHDLITFAAHSAQPVLISGETGTGKGLCARLIHRLSGRGSRAFVRYQPNFVPPEMISSDLFGHTRGAFTGATTDRSGLLLEAHDGTVFLDEIDELPAQVQVLLLGALQEHQFRPLGSNQEQRSNFRLLAASNKCIPDLLASGKLRPDFYHRIAHLEIDIPPLRSRPSDIPVLARHFLQQFSDAHQLPQCDISEKAMQLLSGWSWPGNVRELQAAIEAAAQRMRYRHSRTLEACDVQSGKGPRRSAGQQSLHISVREFKKTLVQQTLTATAGNQLQAAAELGIDRSTLRRILAY